MRSTTSEVAGHHRSGPTGEWASATFTIDEQQFSIGPAGLPAATSVPLIGWPLTEIASVFQLSRPSENVMVVEVTFAGGASLQASLPEVFVADLCERLAEAHDAAGASRAAVPSVEPPLPPTGVQGLSSPHQVSTRLVNIPPPFKPATGTAGATHAVHSTTPTWGDTSQSSITVSIPRSEPQFASSLLRDWRLWGALAMVVLLAISIGVLWTHASTESERADSAEASLATRTTELDESRALHRKVSDELATASEQVENLTMRVSELSNEKAQVQDDRNAAQELNRLGAEASAKMLECRDRVLLVLDYVLDEYYSSASAALDVAGPICDDADAAVAAFTGAL